MARTDNFTNFATDVADSIREKTGETGLIPASEFDTKIKSISSAEDLDEELSTYNSELSEQGVSIDDIITILDHKANTSGNISSRLPEGYQEIDTITSTGTEYINTNVNATSNIKIEINIHNPNFTLANGVLYGGGTGWGNKYLQGELDADTTCAFGNSTKIIESVPTNIYNTYKFVQDINKIYVNDTLLHTFAATSFTTTYPIHLFAYNRSGKVGEYGKYTISYCKIYDSNVLVRDFVPCYRVSDDMVGLYDLLNNVFYPNSGTGAFVKGKNVTTLLQTKTVILTSTEPITISPDNGYDGMRNVIITFDNNAINNIGGTDE